MLHFDALKNTLKKIIFVPGVWPHYSIPKTVQNEVFSVRWRGKQGKYPYL